MHFIDTRYERKTQQSLMIIIIYFFLPGRPLTTVSVYPSKVPRGERRGSGLERVESGGLGLAAGGFRRPNVAVSAPGRRPSPPSRRRRRPAARHHGTMDRDALQCRVPYILPGDVTHTHARPAPPAEHAGKCSAASSLSLLSGACSPERRAESQ